MLKKETYEIKGMTCASCAYVIEDYFKKITNVRNVQVDFIQMTMTIEKTDDSPIRFEQLENIGYRFQLVHQLPNETRKKMLIQGKDNFHIAVMLAYSFLVMALSMGHFSFLNHKNLNLFLATSSTVFLMFYGRESLYALIYFGKNLKGDMKVLTGLGAYSAFFYSIYLLFQNLHADTYFEAMAFIITFSAVGKWLESKSKNLLLSDLKALYVVQDKFCNVLQGHDGHDVKKILVNDVQVGDLVRVLAGEKIPLDGCIVKGEGLINKSILNGESKLESVKMNDDVTSGTINVDGSFVFKVSKRIENSYLSELIRIVENSHQNKASIELNTEKWLQFFVPGIIVLSLFTLIWQLFLGTALTQALLAAINVLVISCPCALGFSAPLALYIGKLQLLKNQILIKKNSTFFQASDCKKIVFDKTGTLTYGEMQVYDFQLMDSHISEEEIINLMAGAAALSTHPLAKCTFEYIKNYATHWYEADGMKNYPGLGIEVDFTKHRVLLGSQKFLEQHHVKINVTPWEERFGSLVLVAIDDHVVGYFLLQDKIRDGVNHLLSYLDKRKCEKYILSGDRRNEVARVANALGIKPHYAHGEVNPLDKCKFIQSAKLSEDKVCMVGDGINDAMALVSADVSISLQSGTDLACEVSDVVILDAEIDKVRSFFHYSERVTQTVYGNLLLSIVYNIIMIPFAMGLLNRWTTIQITPMIASSAMMLSTGSIFLNSSKLLKFSR